MNLSSFSENGESSDELMRFAESESTRKKKILIVDDQEQMRIFMTRMIEREDRYECISAFDGQEALEKALELAPDLVVCDLEMPKMNGYELIGHLKAGRATKDIPIVILSSHDVASKEIRSMIPDGLPALSKNDGFDKILSTIRELL